MTTMAFPDMHDWTFSGADYDWEAARMTMRFRTEGAAAAIVVSEVADIHIPQRRSWGPSVSVNRADWSAGTGGEVYILRIEMQSGDVIKVEAASFEFE